MDEVGEMSMRMQALLLRFLENGEIQRVGCDRVGSMVDVE
jgi:transcriptional regulator with GAF, ATPase, and Fis domain